MNNLVIINPCISITKKGIIESLPEKVASDERLNPVKNKAVIIKYFHNIFIYPISILSTLKNQPLLWWVHGLPEQLLCTAVQPILLPHRHKKTEPFSDGLLLNKGFTMLHHTQAPLKLSSNRNIVASYAGVSA